MKLLAKLLSMLVSFQMAALPVVFAADPKPEVEIQNKLKAMLEHAPGWTYKNADKKDIPSDELVKHGAKEFWMISPEKDAQPSYGFHIKMGNLKENATSVSIAIEVFDGTLSTRITQARAVKLDSKKSPAAGVLELERTMQLIERDVTAHAAAKHGDGRSVAQETDSGAHHKIHHTPFQRVLNVVFTIAAPVAIMSAVLIILDGLVQNGPIYKSFVIAFLISTSLAILAVSTYYITYDTIE